MKNLLKLFILSLTILGLVGAVSAQSYEELEKILASDGEASDLFGLRGGVSGDRAVFGSQSEDEKGSNAGAVYVYEWDGAGWNQMQKLTASDGAAGDLLSGAFVLGDRVVVGSSRDDNAKGAEAGAIYLYDWNGSTWIETEKIIASDGAAGDHFGITVRLSNSGNRITVGASDDGVGSLYVYDWNGSAWVETKLTPSDGAGSDRFGFDHDVSGDTILVGAYLDGPSGSYSGSAYVYDWNGSSWVETKLTAFDGASGDRFGIAVSVSGDDLVVAALRDDDNATDSGSVYMYERNGSSWDYSQKISGVVGSGYFGGSVSMRDGNMVVGANGEDSNTGAAYIYTWNGSSWAQVQKFTAADGVTVDRFGGWVGVSGDKIMIGAAYDDDNGNDSGSVYFFGIPSVPDNFCAIADIIDPIADSIYWDLETNSPYLANSGGTAVVAIVAPAETVKATTAELPAAGTAEPGLVYFDEQTGELYISDASGDLQDPSTITSNAVASPSAAGAVVGEVYFDTTSGELFFCEVDGVLDTPADPSSSCLTQ